MNYRVIRPFYLFIYNPKNHSNKAKKYEVGDIVKRTVFNRLRDKSYVELVK